MHIEPTSPSTPQALKLLEQLSESLQMITGDSGRASFNPSDVEREGAQFVVAYDPHGKAIGCGAYRPLSGGVAELKRMFAAPGTKGVGSAILSFLERSAISDGYKAFWLETRVVNRHAVRFYETHGYSQIANFGKYVGRVEAACFAKELSESSDT